MPYKYLEHTADVGIECTGKNINETFQDAGKALFNVMVDISQVEPIEIITFELKSDSIENLFIEFLNHLLALKDINEAMYSEFDVEIYQKNDEYILSCIAKGEKLDYNKHDIKVEVKSATYHGLKYDEETNTLTTVLDV